MSKFVNINKTICVSVFEGLSLKDYVVARQGFCKMQHKQPCRNCTSLLEVAKIIIDKGFIQLKQAFEIACPNVAYKSTTAKKKLLQMPVASVAVRSTTKGAYRVFLVEKQNHVKYDILQSLLNQWWESKAVEPSCPLTRDTVTNLLKLAESESERKRLKYTIVTASGISGKKAASLYGFSNTSSTVSDVEEALREATAIRNVIQKLAELKDEELLTSLGIPDENCCDSSSSESETDDDNTDISDINNDRLFDTDKQCIDPQELLGILQQCSWNWLEFATKTEKKIQQSGETLRLEHVLEDFAKQLLDLNISEQDYEVIEQSKQVYHQQEDLRKKQDEIDDGMIVSDLEPEDPEELLLVRDPLDDAGKALIKKKREAICRKAKREIKRKIAEKRFLKRRRSKKIGKILQECPGIGKTIEEYVERCGVGADAWRRTGILTFDGNQRLHKKVTFKWIQEHLQLVYNRKFSYGTVVQFCVARNKRRRSAIRYKGLANVVQRRARKGFTLKYNPDVHWSAALYRGLDDLQYTDANNIMNFGRDDQSGFRLDTMATNMQHATLCIRDKPSLTTHVDYVNRYPSVLQTTSYNFPSSKTTGEICVGVVKAQKLFQKNPAQHFADLVMVEQKPEVKPAFINNNTNKPKEIECIRVDGAGDEGPLHEEVQYWWTKRHFEKGNRTMLISTRNSGSSYRNRVELQNGCLTLAHANVFIPSTLHGSCMIDGEVNDEILFRNLHAAIDAYISRVDQAPCAGTGIHLWKGANSAAYQEERTAVNIFLKGKKEEKELLQKEKPAMFCYIKMIWDLRGRHMTSNLPSQYLFFLQCCYDKDCVHPVCKTGVQNPNTWYPDGPLTTFLPMTTPDPTRPYGNEQCKECTGFCSGHYMKPQQLLDHVNKGGKISGAMPPSLVILEAFKKNKGVPDEAIVQELSKQVLLPVDEVIMWLNHLKTVKNNRIKGAKKAAATRKRKKIDHIDKDTETNHEEVCHACRLDEPPPNDGELAIETVLWIGCETCSRWFHTLCVNIETLPDEWHCPDCC